MSTANSGRRPKNIFINYRVHDTAGETGRLADRLKQFFPEDQIFMDIDKIEPGVDFTEAISKSLESCDIMLAVIGPNWLGVDSATNTSRIKEPADWVKTEISAALEKDIKVIPVLVDGASLPKPEELPEELQPLLRRQSLEISNKRWSYDTEQLVNVLIKSGVKPKKGRRPGSESESNRSWWQRNSRWLYMLMGAFIVIVILAIIINQTESSTESPESFDGVWVLDLESGRYEYAIEQQEDSLHINITRGNENIGWGTLGYSDNSFNGTLIEDGVPFTVTGYLNEDNTMTIKEVHENNVSTNYTLHKISQELEQAQQP